MFADPLDLQLAEREPSAVERRAFDGLAEHHRAMHLARVDDLAQRFGEGPALREERMAIERGELSPPDPPWQLESSAQQDERARGEQERLRSEYLAWREEEARRLAKSQGISGRLRNGPETFLGRIDRRSLRLCQNCEEIAYPDPERARYERGARHDVAGRCHFCNSRTLAKVEDEGGKR